MPIGGSSLSLQLLCRSQRLERESSDAKRTASEDSFSLRSTDTVGYKLQVWLKPLRYARAEEGSQ